MNKEIKRLRRELAEEKEYSNLVKRHNRELLRELDVWEGMYAEDLSFNKDKLSKEVSILRKAIVEIRRITQRKNDHIYGIANKALKRIEK